MYCYNCPAEATRALKWPEDGHVSLMCDTCARAFELGLAYTRKYVAIELVSVEEIESEEE